LVDFNTFCTNELKTGMNTLKYFLMTSKYVTSHVTKVYFIELLLNIEYIEFEDKILIKTYENVNDFLPGKLI